MGIAIHATRLMQPGEFAVWGNGKLIVSGLLGSRIEPTMFDAVALHVDDSAVFCVRLEDSPRDMDTILGAIAAWWEHGAAIEEVTHGARLDRTGAGRRAVHHR